MFCEGFEKVAFNLTHTVKRVNSFLNPLKYQVRQGMGDGLLKRTKSLTMGGLSNLSEMSAAGASTKLKPKSGPLKATGPSGQKLQEAFSGRQSNRLGLSKADIAASSPAELDRAKSLAAEGKLNQSSVDAIGKNQAEAAKKLKEQAREKIIARHKRLVGQGSNFAYRHPYMTATGIIAGTKFIQNNTGPRQEASVEYPQQGM